VPVIGPVWLLTLLSSPGLLDLGAHTGLGMRESSAGDGVSFSFAWGLSGGYDLTEVTGWPLRGELLFASDTFGGGRGVDAVDVDSWQGELLALAGIDWPVWGPFHLQLLAGPGARLTWVQIRVLEHKDTTWSLEAFAGLVGGVVCDLGGVHVGLRVMTGAPRPRLMQVYAYAAWEL
jgi:hypothetical protein